MSNKVVIIQRDVAFFSLILDPYFYLFHSHFLADTKSICKRLRIVKIADMEDVF